MPKDIQKICQIERQKIYNKMCQIECWYICQTQHQYVCQKECQKTSEYARNYYSFITDMPPPGLMCVTWCHKNSQAFLARACLDGFAMLCLAMTDLEGFLICVSKLVTWNPSLLWQLSPEMTTLAPLLGSLAVGSAGSTLDLSAAGWNSGAGSLGRVLS